MDNVFFDGPEFSQWYSESQLKENFKVSFEESGWYEVPNGDWLLIIERHGKYKVWVWIGTNPLEEMEKVLDLPTHTVRDD
jgi:hypothetical protein